MSGEGRRHILHQDLDGRVGERVLSALNSHLPDAVTPRHWVRPTAGQVPVEGAIRWGHLVQLELNHDEPALADGACRWVILPDTKSGGQVGHQCRVKAVLVRPAGCVPHHQAED